MGHGYSSSSRNRSSSADSSRSWRSWSRPRRRNSDDNGSSSQYRTNQGPIPIPLARREIRDAPTTRSRSGFPHIYRNSEGPIGARTSNFDSYLTGPGRAGADSTPGVVNEYPIPTPGRLDRFDYNRAATRASTADRPIHHNERRHIWRSDGHPNDAASVRAVTRTTDDGDRELVGVMDHPEGERRRLERAPIEPLSRIGRQETFRRASRYPRTSTELSTTYPPRGYDSSDFTGYEGRYSQVRRPRPQTPPRRRR